MLSGRQRVRTALPYVREMQNVYDVLVATVAVGQVLRQKIVHKQSFHNMISTSKRANYSQRGFHVTATKR